MPWSSAGAKKDGATGNGMQNRSDPDHGEEHGDGACGYTDAAIADGGQHSQVLRRQEADGEPRDSMGGVPARDLPFKSWVQDFVRKDSDSAVWPKRCRVLCDGAKLECREPSCRSHARSASHPASNTA